MKEESYVMVYDLGGGTFDVTLLEMFEGVLEVILEEDTDEADELADEIRELIELEG